MSSMYQEDYLRNISNISSVTLLSQSWMVESTLILFQIKSMVRGTILESLGVPDLYPRSQKHPPWVPDGCQIYSFSIVKIEISVIHQVFCKINPFVHSKYLWTTSLESRMSSLYREGSLRKNSNISSFNDINSKIMIFFKSKIWRNFLGEIL